MPIHIEDEDEEDQNQGVNFPSPAVFRAGHPYRRVLNFDHLELIIELNQQILVNERTLQGKVMIKPSVRLPNCPLIALINGCSASVQTPKKILTMNDTEGDLRFNQSSSENITETVGQTQVQRDQSTPNDAQSHSILREKFLEGDQTLFQLDEDTQKRKQTLDVDTIYTYPIYFLLPSNLPQSISEIVMPGIEISIEYFLTVRLCFPNNEDINVEIPFYLKSLPKQYPYDCLTNMQKIRCYHAQGSQLDPLVTNLVNRVTKLICPTKVYDSCFHSRFNTIQRNYDTFHAEMVVVVNAGHNLHVQCRVYIDPEANSLTIQRCKSKQQTQKQKQTEHKGGKLEAKCARLRLYGELAGRVTTIFEKALVLQEGDYEIMEAEAIIVLDCPLRSYHNELFVLAYFFELKIQFTSLHEHKIEDFLFNETKFELQL